MTDLIAAMEELLRQGGDSEYMTRRELQRATGLSLGKIMDRLHDLNEAGRLEISWVDRITIDGRANKIPAYRLKGSEGE